jgi:hypothetical protein
MLQLFQLRTQEGEDPGIMAVKQQQLNARLKSEGEGFSDRQMKVLLLAGLPSSYKTFRTQQLDAVDTSLDSGKNGKPISLMELRKRLTNRVEAEKVFEGGAEMHRMAAARDFPSKETTANSNRNLTSIQDQLKQLSDQVNSLASKDDKSGKKQPRICQHCKKLGKPDRLCFHKEENCFELHPEKRKQFNFQLKDKANGVSDADIVCGFSLGNKSDDSYSVSNKFDDVLITDSGASTTAIFQRHLLTHFHPVEGNHIVQLANGKTIRVTEYGDLTFFVKKGDDSVEIIVKDSLYVPDLAMNLLSIGHMTRQRYRFKFSLDNNCLITPDSKRISFLFANKLPVLELYKQKDTTCSSAETVCKRCDYQIWHQRLDHCNLRSLNHMVSAKLVDGMQISGPVPGNLQ